MPIVVLRPAEWFELSALLHRDEARDIWQWNWEPTIVSGCALFLALYLYSVGALRPRRHPIEIATRRQVMLFTAGTLVLFLVLVSPLDVLSDDYLFSAHMVQHILLTAVVPPLWLLGTPAWLLLPLIQSRLVARIGRAVTHPVVAFLIFNVVFWTWHWPTLYDAAVANDAIHAGQHLTFIAAGVIVWWPVFSPLRELPRLRSPLRELYLFACCQPGVALGALFVFSRDVIYDAYLTAPRLWGLTPLADQQLGGLIMWIPGNAIYLVTLSVLLLRWLFSEQPTEVRPPQRRSSRKSSDLR